MTLTKLLKTHGKMTIEQIRQFVKRDVDTLKRELDQLEIAGTVKCDGNFYHYTNIKHWRI